MSFGRVRKGRVWKPCAARARRLFLRLAPGLFLRFMRASRSELGLAGEELAARELLRLGWRLRGRRLRTPEGEVDLWATRGQTCLVVEVKTGRLGRVARATRGQAPELDWDLRWRPGGSLGQPQLRRLGRAARRLARREGLRAEVALVEVLVAREGGAVLVLAPRPVYSRTTMKLPCLFALLLLSSSLGPVLRVPTCAEDTPGEHHCRFGSVADPALLPPGAPDVPNPGTAAVCRERREQLAAQLGDGIFLIQAGEEGQGRFEADVDFYYLTALHRPDARLLLVAEGGSLVLDELYLPEQTPRQRLWEGPKLSASDLAQGSPYDAVREASVFDFEALRERATQAAVHAVDERTIDELVEHEIDVKRGRKALNALQRRKSPEELAALETAVDITMAALADAIVVAVPGAWEYQAEAAVEGGFRRRGAEFLAFPSICGSGVNSCYLHYRANNRQLEDGDLLLMDVGAKYHGYSADFTRTIPVNGRFTPRQREIYTLVYQAQQTAVAGLRPGVSMRDVHNIAVEFFEQAGYREHFKHGLGHHLGIRVHDVPGFRGKLEPGMVVTIEPGLYLVEEAIGVRIEDDYLITEDGSRKLSNAIPSAPDELEAYIARMRGQN